MVLDSIDGPNTNVEVTPERVLGSGSESHALVVCVVACIFWSYMYSGLSFYANYNCCVTPSCPFVNCIYLWELDMLEKPLFEKLTFDDGGTLNSVCQNYLCLH